MPVFSIAALAAQVAEGDTGDVPAVATFLVTRSQNTAGADTVLVNVEPIVGPLRSEASDFAALALPSALVEFAPGEAEKTVSISILPDLITNEGDEGFDVVLSNPSAGSIDPSAASAGGVILDDDPIRPQGAETIGTIEQIDVEPTVARVGRDVVHIDVGGTAYVYVAANVGLSDQPGGIQAYRQEPDGQLTFLAIFDGLENRGVNALAPIVVDGDPFLLAGDFPQSGVSPDTVAVYAVGSDGLLTLSDSLPEDGAFFELRAVRDIEPVLIGGRSFFLTGQNKLFGIEVTGTGALVAQDVLEDDDTVNFGGNITEIEQVALDGRTFAVVVSQFEPGITVVEVGPDGTLTPLRTNLGTDDTSFTVPLSVTAANVDGRAFVFATGSSSSDQGITTLELTADGVLTPIARLLDIGEEGVGTFSQLTEMTTFEYEGRTFLVGLGGFDGFQRNRLNLLEVEANGELVYVARALPDDDNVLGKGSGTFVDVEVDGEDVFAFLSGGDNDIILSTFDLSPQLQDYLASEPGPVGTSDEYEVAEDEVLEVSAPGVLANDGDVDGDALTAELVSDVSNGTLDLEADGSFAYAPAADFNGTDGFVYTVSNETGGVSAPATVTLTVTAVDDAPVAEPDVGTLTANGVLVVGPAVGVLANDSDVDGDALTAELVLGPTNGVLDLAADGSYVYTPDEDFAGADEFIYRAIDEGGLPSAPVAVELTIEPDAGGPKVQSLGPPSERIEYPGGLCVLTGFDVDGGGEGTADTLALSFGGSDLALSTTQELLDFVLEIETDGDGRTDAFVFEDDLVFALARDVEGALTDAVVLQDVVGRDGLTLERLQEARVDEAFQFDDEDDTILGVVTPELL